MQQAVKEVIAVLIALAGLALGVIMMLQGESQVVIGETPEARQLMLDGLMTYFKGFGLAVFLAGVAYILVDGEEDVTTVLSPASTRK